jgi:hypothetical protein
MRSVLAFIAIFRLGLASSHSALGGFDFTSLHSTKLQTNSMALLFTLIHTNRLATSSCNMTCSCNSAGSRMSVPKFGAIEPLDARYRPLSRGQWRESASGGKTQSKKSASQRSMRIKLVAMSVNLQDFGAYEGDYSLLKKRSDRVPRRWFVLGQCCYNLAAFRRMGQSLREVMVVEDW